MNKAKTDLRPASFNWKAIKINWDAMADDVTELKGGTPMGKDGNVANDANCYGILMEDTRRRKKGEGRVIVAGRVDLKEAEENSGIVLSEEAMAALVDVEFPGSGGAFSWNDLTDKPFGENRSDTLTWNGDTTGLEVFAEMYFRVTDNAAALDDVDLSEAYVTINDGTALPYLGMQVITEGEHFVLLFGETEDDAPPVYYFVTNSTAVDCRAGVYLASADGMYISSLVIPGFEFYKKETKKLDASYIPATCFYVNALTTAGEYLYLDWNCSQKATRQELVEAVKNNLATFCCVADGGSRYLSHVFIDDYGDYAEVIPVVSVVDGSALQFGHYYTAEYTREE